jgi:hypothetical protein
LTLPAGSLARIKGDCKRVTIYANTWAVASRNRADQPRARAELLSVEVEAADVDTELVSRLAAVLRSAAERMDDEKSVAPNHVWNGRG